MVECSRKRIMSKDATFASVESENEGTKRLKSANGEKNSNVSSVPSQNNGETSFQRCCNTLLADKVLSLNRNIGQKAAKNDANGIETIEEPQVVPSNFTPALDFVNAKKTIPRCYPKSTDQILTLARQQLILNIIKRDIKHSMIEYVCIDIQQSSSNSYTDEVTLTAPRKVMNDVICKVDKILSDSIALYNIKNMNCIELILQLETSGSIGGKVYDICPEMENQVGLLVVGANEGSELHKVVGPAVKTGLCISQIEEIKVVSSIQVKNAWHVVRKRGSRFANVTCSFPKSSDLSSILAERIIKKHIINARILEDTIIASNDTTTDDGSMSSEISVILPPVDKILVKPEGKTKVASFESDQIEQDTNKHMEKLVTLSQKRKHTEKDMLSENKHLETSEKMEDSSWNKIFRKKFNPVCDIEYQKMVKKNTALGSMWRKHKLLYGDVCNEDCMCVSDLKTLCENVIQDSKKSTKFNIDSYNEVGFVSHFHPRFYKKVKEGYPSLNGAIILEKLVKMWKKHTRTMRYGMKCNKNCECEDGWENIFVPTFLGPMETIAKSVNTSKCVPKKSLPEGKTSHSTSTQKLKKKTILLKGDKSGALIQPSQKVSLLANIQTPSAQNFSYTFDTDKPMGICFFTINSVCTVLSVDRNNQVISNTGIKAGFIVKTVLVKDSITHSKTVDILSHDMVKVLYKNAAKGKKKLRLSFTQGSVESFEKEIRTDFWTDNGEWKGFHLHHWAGGSPCVYSPLPCSSSSKERNNSSAESMIECTQNLRKLRDTNLTAESILRITKYTENGNNFGLRSAHTVSSIPTLKKVRFCDGDALSSVVSYVTFIQCEEKHKDDSVVKKALSMDFKEFLNFLLSGADFSQEDMWEKSPTIHINQKICDIRDTIEHGNCNSFSKKSKTAELKDLELKSTLLQIYSDGEVLLENAEKMWKWATIEYKLFGLDQLVLKERGRSDAHVENLIFCVAKVNHEKLISSELSHEKEYHDSVCWNDNESSFKFHYNLESDRSHDLCFEISVFKGAVKVNFPQTTNVRIAIWKNFPIPNNIAVSIKKKWSQGGYEKYFEDYLIRPYDGDSDNKNYIQNGARIKCKLCIASGDDNLIGAKKKILSRNIALLIDRIEQLQNRVESDVKLDSSLKNTCNFSLLHAAIITEDEQLVQRLLNLGADSTVKFTSSLIPVSADHTTFFYGSSLDLVELMLKKATSKICVQTLSNIKLILLSSLEKHKAETFASNLFAEKVCVKTLKGESNHDSGIVSNEQVKAKKKPLTSSVSKHQDMNHDGKEFKQTCTNYCDLNCNEVFVKNKKTLLAARLPEPSFTSSSLEIHKNQYNVSNDAQYQCEQLYPITNFQNVYVKIFPKGSVLKNDLCWHVKHNDIGTTVIFKSPQESYRHYYPEGFGGQLRDEIWWYSDVKTAKMVAFSVFLNSLVREGVLKDAQHDKMGKVMWKGTLKQFDHNVQRNEDVAFL